MASTRIARARLCAIPLLLVTATTQAQTTQQVVTPPKVMLWMDVSTGGMAGMPEFDMPGMGGLMGGMAGMGKGGPGARNTNREYYGAARTFHITPPRVLDIALWNGLKPGVEAAQRIPPGLKLGDKLPLLPVIENKVVDSRETSPDGAPVDYEAPKGRILFYWGCNATVQPGQPRILDLSKLGAGSAASFGSAFSGRFAPDRGAKVRAGYDVFPNERDQRALPRDASLVGEHQVTGDSVPASFKFNLGPAHDVMPAIELQSQGGLKDSVALSWIPVTNAKAYFLNAMGAQGDDMVFWSSSEVPDTGFGLFDYLSNGTIDKWIAEKVILGSGVTQCAVPKGIFAAGGAANARGREDAGAMLRMVAYGGEHGFVHPPRPTDVKIPWNQEWSVRLRAKSQTMAMLGEDTEQRPKAAQRPGRGKPPAEESMDDGEESKSGNSMQVPSPANLLKGLFGR
jgi:hypothetical protein